MGLLATEEGLKAVINNYSKNGPDVPSVHGPGEKDRLRRELGEVLAQLARAHTNQILMQDYEAKLARGKARISWLEGIRDVLLNQAARAEVVHLLAQAELTEVAGLVMHLQDITKDFGAEAKAETNFKTAVLGLKEGLPKGDLIPPEDLLMLRVHRVLGLWKRDTIGHLPTYSSIRSSLSSLTEETSKLSEDLEEGRKGRETHLQAVRRDAAQLTRAIGIDEAKQRVSLAPRRVKDSLASLEVGVRELELGLKNQIDSWEKEKQNLKNTPYLKLQRDVWVDFIVRPQVLAANVKELENKVKR